MDWANVPTKADIAAAYPSKARQAGVEGGAALFCSATTSGDMKDCVGVRDANGVGLRRSGAQGIEAVQAQERADRLRSAKAVSPSYPLHPTRRRVV
jgi:hypothetical protein